MYYSWMNGRMRDFLLFGFECDYCPVVKVPDIELKINSFESSSIHKEKRAGVNGYQWPKPDLRPHQNVWKVPNTHTLVAY